VPQRPFPRFLFCLVLYSMMRASAHDFLKTCRPRIEFSTETQCGDYSQRGRFCTMLCLFKQTTRIFDTPIRTPLCPGSMIYSLDQI
jgi:hypothetical protein